MVKSRISSYIQEKEEQITLCVSGMAAIFSALRLVQMKYLADQQFTVNDPDEILQHAQTVVFGFPYIDTLKVSNLYIIYDKDDNNSSDQTYSDDC